MGHGCMSASVKGIQKKLACEQLSVLGWGEKIARRGKEKVRACRKTFEAAIPPSCLVIAGSSVSKIVHPSLGYIGM